MPRDYDALGRYLAERRTMPFAWGRKANDCVSFAGGAAFAQTGKDWLTGLRWSSQRQAIGLLTRLGGLDVAISARLPEIAPAHAHRGDIAGVACDDMPGGIRLMVIVGELLVGPGERGGEFQARAAMIRAWSIG